MFKRLVRLERSLEKELELDIANLKPTGVWKARIGSSAVDFFRRTGSARPS